MTERPVVLHRDVLVAGQDDVPEPSPSAGRRRVAGLVLAAALGFGVAQLVPGPASDRGTTASLALVAGRQPHLEVTAADPPVTGLEVTLVNTGPQELRLDSATVEGTALRWDVDRPLEPGRQAAALLLDDEPCDGPLDELSGGGGAREVRVASRDAASGNRLPDVLLELPPTVGRQYDDHVRLSCALPRLQESVELVTLAPELDGDALVVALGLQSRTVRDVQVVGVAWTLLGLQAQLTDADGRPVPLPLTVAGRSRREIAQGFQYDSPGSTPYRLRVTAGTDACAGLRERAGAGSVAVTLVDPDEPAVQVDRSVPVDLTPLVDRRCPPTG